MTIPSILGPATPRHAPPAAAPTGPAIETRDLAKTYPGGVRALQGMTFAVAPGTVFGLLGPNGAGKSTTVKVLTTLSRPDSGTARVAGHDVVRHPERVRRAIGCVGQRVGCDVQATGRENLVLQGQLHGLRGRHLTRRVDALLERFGLGAVARRVAGTYSGGMQRRLDLAMGLVHRPEVLFLDEPTNGLDPEARSDLQGEITRLTREEGLTILLTTHYLEEADRLADRVAIVAGGAVVAEGTPDELKRSLRGDAIQVQLDGPAEGARLRLALRPLGERVAETIVDGSWLRARVDDGAAALPAVLAAAEAAGVRVTAVTVARPSLDDVYLRHTGRTLHRPAAAEVR